MLINIVEECTSTIRDAANLRKEELSLQAYEKAIQDLCIVAKKIDDLIDAIEAINNSQFDSMSFSEEQIADIKAAISDCGQACSTQSLAKSNVDALSATISKYNSQVGVYWQSIASSATTPLVSYLSVVENLLDNKEKVKEIEKELQSKAKSAPTPENISALSKAIEKANEVADSYKMSPGVEKFLEKVKSGKATMADITPEVATWINDKALSGKIRISF